MNTVFSVISLLGGLAMFLYGMEVMGDGLKRGSGPALKRVLGKMTTNPIMGFLTGLLVTAVIQSSTATIVLTVGLISVGILTLNQAVSIVLGAHIGTTVTAQIIRLMDIDSGGSAIIEFFKPSTLAPVALLIGIILIMFIKSAKVKSIGDICMGFGILFSGLLTMTTAVAPLTEGPGFAKFLTAFSNIPVLGIVTGFICTAVVQSSSAMVGIVQAISMTGTLSFKMVYPIIIGINIGTCVTTAVVCSIGSNRDAKRTGIVHITFSVIGTVIFMTVLTILRSTGKLPDLWDKIVSSGDIANFQTLFNLVTAIILLPFTNQLVKFSKKLVKPVESELKTAPEWTVLDEKLYISAPLALEKVRNAMGEMGTLALKNLISSISLLTKYDTNVHNDILANEETLDAFADTSDNYLVGLAQHTESNDENLHINALMQVNGDFERIGDYATNIGELAQRLVDDKMSFSEIAKKELASLCDAVSEITETTITAFTANNTEIARKIEPLEEVIDDMVVFLRDRHINRLKTGECTISAGLVFLETLTYLERVADQCSATAVLILAKDDPAILQNHHEYLRVLHEGGDSAYVSEMNTKREQYMSVLEKIN